MRDYKRSSGDLVRELINSNNSLPFEATSDNLIFGKASALLDDERGSTRIKVRGVQDSEFRNKTVEVFYDRLDLGILFGGAYRPAISALGQSSLWRLLPDINKALGTAFTERDLEDVDVTQLGEGDQLTLELRARPGSPAFKGFTRITFNRERIYLTDVVETRTFSELSHPDPLLVGYTSAGLLTWGLDFTLIYPQLEVVNHWASWRGNYRYLSDLQVALKENYGIENWPGNNTDSDGKGLIRDYDTRKVPEANTNFQRVVVQTDIRSNGYVGTAYFHYNRV